MPHGLEPNQTLPFHLKLSGRLCSFSIQTNLPVTQGWRCCFSFNLFILCWKLDLKVPPQMTQYKETLWVEIVKLLRYNWKLHSIFQRYSAEGSEEWGRLHQSANEDIPSAVSARGFLPGATFIEVTLECFLKWRTWDRQNIVLKGKRSRKLDIDRSVQNRIIWDYWLYFEAHELYYTNYRQDKPRWASTHERIKIDARWWCKKIWKDVLPWVAEADQDAGNSCLSRPIFKLWEGFFIFKGLWKVESQKAQFPTNLRKRDECIC